MFITTAVLLQELWAYLLENVYPSLRKNNFIFHLEMKKSKRTLKVKIFNIY